MLNSVRAVRAGLLALLVAWAAPCQAPAFAEGELDPAWGALTDCPSQPGCDAIVLLDETVLSNVKLQAQLDRRRIVKVFTEKGVGKMSDVDILETKGYELVRNLTGRVFLPGGRIVPLPPENVTLKTLVKKRTRQQQVRSAHFPGVVPGAVIEHSYRLVDPRVSDYQSYLWELQDVVPVMRSTMTIKPGATMFTSQLLGAYRPILLDSEPKKGVLHYEVKEIPALAREPHAPPDEALRARVFFYNPLVSGSWLGRLTGIFANVLGAYLKKGGDVPRRTREVIQGANEPLARMERIYRFVQQDFGTEEARLEAKAEGQVKEAENVGEVLARGHGNEFERTMLFLAMAKEAGLEAGLLLISGRDHGALNTGIPDERQFDSFGVAVKTSENWTFYDPATRHCPFGMIAAGKEGLEPNALIVKPAAEEMPQAQLLRMLIGGGPYMLVRIPVSGVQKNTLTRQLNVTLQTDGAAVVEGFERGSGLVDLDHREAYGRLPDAQRETALRDAMTARIPGLQLESVSFEDLDSFDKAALIRYRLKVPGLAMAAGDRLVVTPSLFSRDRANPFAAEKRSAPVHFAHTVREVEQTVIAVPEGYEPGELPADQLIREGTLMLRTGVKLFEQSLIFTRQFEVGTVVWPPEDYPRLRDFHEKVREADRQVVVFHRKKEAT